MTLRAALLAFSFMVAASAAGASSPHPVLPHGNPANEAVIDPPVSVPTTTPCVVPLVSGGKFGANAVTYNFTPPKACPGPWAKVVLHMSIGLDAGVQYDRSGTLFLGGIPLWFGTTAEPTPQLGPHWNFEKDVTDYTAIFGTAQSGYLQIANYQSSVYTSTITASATLYFYPTSEAFPPPVVADMVLPLFSGGVATLNAAAPSSNATNLPGLTGNLPTNILHATADLYLQGQSGDEFWYTCVPNALTNTLESCGGGALREGEISVDGQPAGVAPIYPWIFTGGIDPLLWAPLPGVQTLNFTAFHADLSPFAGALSDGTAHNIGISVYGDNGYFSAAGALRLFLDHGAKTVTGGITQNTLAATPNVAITPKLQTNKKTGEITGTVLTTDKRVFVIAGTVTGSAGTMTNVLSQNSSFSNAQSFDINAVRYVQNITQSTDITITSTSRVGGVASSATETRHYPLGVDITEFFYSDGSASQTTAINQKFLESYASSAGGKQIAASGINDTIITGDTLFFDSNFNLTGNVSQSETAHYNDYGYGGACYSKTLRATNGLLNGPGVPLVTAQAACQGK